MYKPSCLWNVGGNWSNWRKPHGHRENVSMQTAVEFRIAPESLRCEAALPWLPKCVGIVLEIRGMTEIWYSCGLSLGVFRGGRYVWADGRFLVCFVCDGCVPAWRIKIPRRVRQGTIVDEGGIWKNQCRLLKRAKGTHSLFSLTFALKWN